MDVAAVADQVRSELQSLGKPDRAAQEKRYLKSDYTHYGVPVPAIRKVATAAVREKPARPELLALAETLWTTSPPVHELRMAAIEILIKRVSLLDRADLAVAERLIRDSASWVYVDALAEKVVGALLARDPRPGARPRRLGRRPLHVDPPNSGAGAPPRDPHRES